jgi:hypothetical protein
VAAERCRPGCQRHQGQEDDRESDAGVRFKLFDDGSALVSLLVENDRLQAKAFKEASNRLARLASVPEDDENFGAAGRYTRALGGFSALNSASSSANLSFNDSIACSSRPMFVALDRASERCTSLIATSKA